MITAATVERFRGIQRLEVDGFGRVNLIIGKNDCGKTALMEALWIADATDPTTEAAGVQLLHLTNVPVIDFERFWLPIFWRHDATLGFSVQTKRAEGDVRGVTVREAQANGAVLAVDATRGLLRRWALDVETIVNGVASVQHVVATPEGLQVPPVSTRATRTARWAPPTKSLNASDIRLFSSLKQTGRDAQVLEILRQIDDRASSIELLSPTGSEAEVFVRVGPDMPLLPLASMGDGFQRSFEIFVAASGLVGPGLTLFIDEIDNGLHHSVLESVWRWLAAISKKRDMQIFATSHSEECIHAAARAFAALDDDGLRVVRLDRREDRTTAAVYNRDLVEATARMDVEIRG